MHEQELTIYQQLLSPTPALIDKLMGEQGEAMLDRQILKIRDQIGDEQFHQYAQEFFKDTKIDYRQFFNIKPTQAKQQAESQPQTTTNQEEQEIIEGSVHQQKGQAEEQLEVIQADPEEYTNNSEEIDNGFEEIEKTELGNNSYKIKYKNGDVYQGEMEEGIKNGWGVYYYQSGEKYSGCFIDDEINGYGRYYFLSGAEYEGDWSSGMKHGIGILTFANKDVYEGEFCKDDLHGKGTYRYNNGDLCQGQFSKGKRHGAGTFSGADGRLQIGQWIQDKFSV